MVVSETFCEVRGTEALGDNGAVESCVYSSRRLMLESVVRSSSRCFPEIGRERVEDESSSLGCVSTRLHDVENG